MKKQILTGALALGILANGAIALANEPVKESLEIIPISVELNDEIPFDLSDIKTYEKNGTLMVPLRQVVEEIYGLDVKWNDETRSVEIGSGPQWTSITIGKNAYFFARIAPFELGQPPEIKEGKTYVPAEFFTRVIRFKPEEIKEEERPEPEGQTIRGFINKVSEHEGKYSLTIMGDGKSSVIDEIVLYISEETEILDENEKKVNVEDLRPGAIVEAKTMPFMTLSLPPQSTARKIIVLNSDVKIKDTFYKENEELKYPTLEGLKKSKEINSEIENLIKELAETEIYEGLELIYDIKLLSENRLSMVFYGNFKFGDKDKFLMKSLNFDLEFEAEGKQIFFKASKIIVFYYPLDDTVIYPLNVELPLESLEGLIK